MKKQQRKQAKLIYRMLPRVIVQKMNAGEVRTESLLDTTILHLHMYHTYSSMYNLPSTDCR